MPNHSTPETPGSTTDDLPLIGHIEVSFMRCMTGQIPIRPGGILHAIQIASQVGDIEFAEATIDFELTDANFVPLYAKLHKPSVNVWPISTYDMLMIIPNPFPNLNNVFPPIFHWRADREVSIRQIISYHKLI